MTLPIPPLEALLLVLAIYLAYIILKKKKDPRYPPGPSSLPIIGNVLQLGSQPHKVFIEWADKYGDAFSCKMGTEDMVMLNEAEIIKEVFALAESAGRTTNPILLALAKGNYGIIVGEGAHWEEQRRFTIRTLRTLGFGKTSMEVIILEEVNAIFKYFEKRKGQPIQGHQLFNGAVVNALWKIISGERQAWDGPEKPKILQYAADRVDGLNRTNQSGLWFAPIFRHIAPGYFGWTKWVTGIANVVAICNTSITRHLAKLDDENPQDLIDHYLVKMKRETDPNSSFYKKTGEKNMIAVITDLFLAGSETTSATLSWLMIHLAHNQRVLKKMQDELDTVIGTGRQPSLSDRPSLPYTEATILEILRRTSVLNAGAPHRMLQDAVINGYFFPKNTTVISNIYRVHNNPKVWGDPENFRPERFLSEDGVEIVKNENFIPFSVGRRVCLGESLARDTLFLFLACIAQRFDIQPAPGSKPDVLKNVQPNDKMVNEPAPFEIFIDLRN